VFEKNGDNLYITIMIFIFMYNKKHGGKFEKQISPC